MEDYVMDLRGVFNLLRRRIRIIVSTFIVGMLLCAVVLFFLPQLYTSSSLVIFDPSQKNILDPGSASISSSESARVDSEVALVKSRDTLLDVIRSESLLSSPEFAPRLGWQAQLLAFLNIRAAELPTGEEALKDIVQRLDGATSASRLGSTFLISISATTADPEVSAKVANALAAAYVRAQLASKVQSVEASRDMLQARISSGSDSISAAETAYDEFIARAVNASGDERLVTLRRDIDNLASETAALTTTSVSLEQDITGEDWSRVAQTLQSEALALLERQRQDLDTRLNGAMVGSQLAVDLGNELKTLQDELAKLANDGLTSVRTRLADTQSKSVALQSQLQSTLISSGLPSETLTQLYELQRKSETARRQYDGLVTRFGELENQAFLQIADSRIAAYASAPTSPSFPNPRLVITLAAFASLGLGIALAFVYENYLGGFTDEAQASSVLKIPFAAAVPLAKKKGTEKVRSFADHVVSSPLSRFSESVRRIRLSIELSTGQQYTGGESAKGIVIMVTSATPGEGKTTLALALSRAFSVAGKRTLLVDSDLRNPRVHQQLGLDPSAGLMDYLRQSEGASSISSILARDELSDVAVALGARTSASSTDQLVAGATFGRLLAAATKTFDVIILDSPPISPAVDALYLSRFADAIVFVVKWATTGQSEVRSALDALEQAKRSDAPIIGALQQVQHTVKQGNYGGYYVED